MLELRHDDADAAVLLKLNSPNHQPSQPGDYRRADLRGADLAGVSLAFLSLAGARLDGADLTGARLMHVDLTNASLTGARLQNARFESVRAGSASFAGAQAAETRWELADLTGASFAGADLNHTVIRGCTLEMASFENANLADSMLVHSNADGACFRQANLLWANTTDTTFTKADFAGARDFFLCREIVVEILARVVPDEWELIALVGAAAANRRWCYPEWKRFLEARPEARALAFEIFRQYPASGCRQALENGWKPAHSDPAKPSAGVSVERSVETILRQESAGCQE